MEDSVADINDSSILLLFWGDSFVSVLYTPHEILFTDDTLGVVWVGVSSILL